MITLIRAAVYFLIEWVDANHQSPATCIATDSLQLGRLCKRDFNELSLNIYEFNLGMNEFSLHFFLIFF